MDSCFEAVDCLCAYVVICQQLQSLVDFTKKMKFCLSELFCVWFVPITPLIHTPVVLIRGVIGKTFGQIASATGIGYWHNGSMKFSNKLTMEICMR